MTKELKKRVVLEIGERLKLLGYKKRAGGIFTCEAAQGFLGWLGLNDSTKAGILAINPVVGLRCQELERHLSDLCGETQHSYVPPTISSPLGYLMSENSFHQWFFETEEDLAEVQSLVMAFSDYGIPFIRASASLEALQQRLETGKYSIGPSAWYRLPLILAMRGEKAAAMQMCEDFLAEMDRPVTVEPYRRFAVALAEMP